MKMSQLKQHVLTQWKSLHSWCGELTSPLEQFDSDIRKQFGDRRYKTTWVRALAYYQAQRVYESCIDSTLLITHTLNFSPQDRLYEYRNEILDAFLQYENGLDLIKQGLENLYFNGFTAQDSESAYGILKLLEAREGQRSKPRALSAT
ncbi:MAG: hypothetical protein AAGI69_28495 [Cyanobacteria bacterium P01_H01_bin.21]